MSDVTSRFTIAGTDYDYQADEIAIRWEEDRDNFRRVDLVVESDIRSKLPVISFRSVLVAENANAEGVSAAELYDLIEQEVAAGNTATFVPDVSLSAPNSATPSIEVVTRGGGHPASYRVEQGADRLRRALKLQGARWLDPNVTADKDLIDDLTSLQDPL